MPRSDSNSGTNPIPPTLPRFRLCCSDTEAAGAVLLVVLNFAKRNMEPRRADRAVAYLLFSVVLTRLFCRRNHECVVSFPD